MSALSSSSHLHPYYVAAIDAELKDFTHALNASLQNNHSHAELLDEITALATNLRNPNSVLPCLSVRTGFDLYLSVMRFPVGSEVIMSAINIPSMVDIVKQHNLIPVPCDIHMDTLKLNLHDLKHLVGPRTVAIVIAHLFGKRNDLSDVIEFAREKNLEVIEDSAECFSGLDQLGDARCDLSMFSFGTLKTNSAFGGAIIKVRDADVACRMRHLQAQYPVQTTFTFIIKTIRCAMLAALGGSKTFSRMFTYACHLGHYDHKKLLYLLIRNVPNHQLLRYIRHQMCDAQLSFLLHRLRSFSKSAQESKTARGDYLTNRLPSGITHPGYLADDSKYWLYPVLVDLPDRIVQLLNAAGIDAYRGATQTTLIEPPYEIHIPSQHKILLNASLSERSSKCEQNENEPLKYPNVARYMMDHIVYLPVSKLVPFQFLDIIVNALVDSLRCLDSEQSEFRLLKSKL